LAAALLQICVAEKTFAQQPPATPADQPPSTTDQPAAEGAAPKKTAEEEIVVTGTRVRRKDLTTPAPVTVINKDQVVASGKVTIGDYLQTLPEQGNAANTQLNNGGSGATRVDLRGLGVLRTLTLVNGRRMVAAGVGGESGSGVDLNTIPIAAVERIEILKDGASAVYGSDAISGVINIITRKNYSGTEANAYLGTTSHGDGTVYDLNVTTGSSGDLGSILFSGGYFHQGKVMAGERDWSTFQLQGGHDWTTGVDVRQGSSRVPNSRILAATSGGTGNATYQALLNRYPGKTSFTFDPTNAGNPSACQLQAGGGGSADFCWRPFNATAMAPDGYHGAPSGDLYNFQPLNYDLTPSRRISLFTTGNTKVVGDVARAYFEGSYVSRESQLQLAYEPLIIGTNGNPVTISANNFYNPFGRDFTQYTKRLTEFGPRTYDASVDTFRIVGGVNGTIEGAWTWDVSLNYGRTQWTQVDRGHLVQTHLQNAIGPTYRAADGTLHCGTSPATDIPGCVPLDLFHGDGAITPQMAGYVTYPLNSRISNELTAAQANFGGELPFKLLSDRPLGVAAGYEFRYEFGADTPDPVSIAGESTGNNRQETHGGFHVHEGYAELSVPIANGIQGVENLEASAAVRVFKYNTFGTDATYKLGGRWSLIRDLTVRGTYSTAFRAPSITELFLGQSDNFPALKDPCAVASLSGLSLDQAAACRAAGVPETGSLRGETQLRTRNGGNPNLQAETAKTWTVGMVIEPRMVRNLSFTVDYYNITIDNAINALGGAFILSQCYPVSGTPDPAQCAKVQRDPGNAFAINRIDDLNTNVGGFRTAGIDLSSRYSLPTEYGRFGGGVDLTWLRKFDVVQPNGTLLRGRGNYDVASLNNGIGGVYPAWKGLGSLTWFYRGVSVGTLLKWVGSFIECETGVCSDPNAPDQSSRRVSAYYKWDGYVSYDFRTPVGNTILAFGVQNILDVTPPLIYNSFTPTSDATGGYDFIGRFFYGRLTQRF
jgi:outer membrane receptor protein involved in Fe transport